MLVQILAAQCRRRHSASLATARQAVQIPRAGEIDASSGWASYRSPVAPPTDACRWSDKPTAGERRPERTVRQFDPSVSFHRARYGSWQTPIGSGVTSGTNSGFSENFPKVSSGVHRKSIIAFDTPSNTGWQRVGGSRTPRGAGMPRRYRTSSRCLWESKTMRVRD